MFCLLRWLHKSNRKRKRFPPAPSVHSLSRGHMSNAEEAGVCEAGRVLPRSWSCRPLLPGIQPPELWEHRSPLLKPLSVWHFIVAAQDQILWHQNQTETLQENNEPILALKNMGMKIFNKEQKEEIHNKNDPSWPSGIYSRDINMAQYLKISQHNLSWWPKEQNH